MRVFRLSKRRAGTVLGPLEDDIMEIVWAEAEPVSVARVHRARGRRKKTLAYSTVKAVLTNLAGKGLLRKRSEGRSNVFSAVQTREAFRQGVVDEVIGSLVKLREQIHQWHLLTKVPVRAELLIPSTRVLVVATLENCKQRP